MFRIEAIKHGLPSFSGVYYPTIFEFSQVLRYGRNIHLKHIRKITNTQLLLLGQQKEYL